MAPLSHVLLLFALCCCRSTLALLLPPSSPLHLAYHHGPLLAGPAPIKLSLLFYGHFDLSDRSTLKAFLSSLTAPISAQAHRRSLRGSLLPIVAAPSVASWWSLTQHYTDLQGRHVSQSVEVEKEMDDPYSLGKRLTASDMAILARRSAMTEEGANSLVVILTSADVAVEGFCMHACGGHSFTSLGDDDDDAGSSHGVKTSSAHYHGKVPYLWVGNSKLQCPGYCAWPFVRPQYGPPMTPLKAPNGVGVDGMIISLAKLLVGAATNPVGNAFYKGNDVTFGREAGEVCAGRFGEGAYPGFPGELLQDMRSGVSYNMEGINGLQFLVPWIWNLATETCAGQA